MKLFYGKYVNKRNYLHINGIGLTYQAIQIAHFEVGKGKGLLPVGDNPRQAAAQKVKPPADRLHQIGVEAVKAEKLLVLKFLRPVDLFAKQNGPGVLAVEENQPVAQQALFVGLDEIDLAAFLRWLATAPHAHGIEILRQADVAIFIGKEVFEILERGDQLALALLRGDVFDGVADGQHRFGIHDVMEIAVGNGDQITQPDLGAGAAMVHTHGLGTILEMVMIRFELGLEPFGRRLLTIGFC